MQAEIDETNHEPVLLFAPVWSRDYTSVAQRAKLYRDGEIYRITGRHRGKHGEETCALEL